jgi:twitching motility protein PilT
MANYTALLKELLEITIRELASDLHISVGHPPILRINGRLIPLVKIRKITIEDAEKLSLILLTPEQHQRLFKKKEIDFSYNYENKIRLRTNVFFQKGNVSIAFRCIPTKIRTIEELSLLPIFHRFTQPNQGFILITGPSGHGKSTTLAALIDEINHSRPEHIITIEDPIEYVFDDDRSIIDQREIHQDTLSFANALRATFRQDPNVIMVGEMRDIETIEIALTAAETGHLVFATLHTNNASQTIHRIVSVFPSVQQEQIRAQLSGSLFGVVSQRLIPRLGGGLIPACEIMFNTPAVANLIRENKIHEIDFVIETSSETGMISLNKSLRNLIKAKEISLENGLSFSLNPSELRKLIRD